VANDPTRAEIQNQAKNHIATVDGIRTELPQRVLDTLDTACAASAIDLARDEEVVSNSELGHDIADYRFRVAVGGRRVDDRAAAFGESSNCGAIAVAVSPPVAVVSRAHADDGHGFAS